MLPHPTIGIRPTIDGRRRGVRESLETKTMAMAHAVAGLLESSLRHRDGESVRCVIAPSTIGGVAEAQACAALFARENVGLTITVTPCWCYGTETIDLNPLTPHAIWGFNGTERPGAVYLAAAMAAYAQRGIPAFAIYGRDVQDLADDAVPQDVREPLLRFARAGLAVAAMRGQAYLSVGGVSMGIAGSMVSDEFFGDYLGMRTEFVDMSEVSRRIEGSILDESEYAVARQWVAANCTEGADRNPDHLRLTDAARSQTWDYVVKMALVLRDLMVGNPALADRGFGEEAQGHGAIVAGFQGQRQWTDYRPNGDFAEAILNSSFDWTGRRAPHLLATENDALNGATMLFGHLLTNTAQIFADVRTYWSPAAVERVTGHRLTGAAAGGLLHLINSGSATLDGAARALDDGRPTMKPYWELTDAEAAANLAATTWYPASREYFPGSGFSSHFVTLGGMDITMARLNLVRGLGPVLQIAEGVTVDLPEEVHRVLDERTDPTWPTTWFAPRITGEGAFGSVYDVMAAWGANHGAIACGHIGAELLTLASMLRIPVAMHNVDASKVQRPKVWDQFGTRDREGADFRACATFGPLYG